MFSLELQIKTKPGFCQPKKKEEEILSTELSWQHWNRSPRSLPGVGHQVGQGAGESRCFDGSWWRFGGTEVTGTRSAWDAQTGPGFLWLFNSLWRWFGWTPKAVVVYVCRTKGFGAAQRRGASAQICGDEQMCKNLPSLKQSPAAGCCRGVVV